MKLSSSPRAMRVEREAPATQQVEPAALIVLTHEQLRALVGNTMREVMNEQRTAPEGYLDMTAAAAYLGTTLSSLRTSVARGKIVPDHRGSRGGGMKGNRFSRSTLDAFCKRTTAG